jgi:hypothetical protein
LNREVETYGVTVCGRLAAKGGIRAAERFVFELEDPVLKRQSRNQHRITVLPVAGLERPITTHVGCAQRKRRDALEEDWRVGCP